MAWPLMLFPFPLGEFPPAERRWLWLREDGPKLCRLSKGGLLDSFKALMESLAVADLGEPLLCA